MKTIAAAAAVWLSSLAARADLPPLVPRDVLFGNPERAAPLLSPDGQSIAWLAPDAKNVLQVWVRGPQGEPRQVTHDKSRGIRTHAFAHDGRTLLYLQDAGGDENFHLFGVDLAAGNVRDYTPFEGVRASILALHPDFPDTVLVELNVRDRQVFDVWRLDLRTGGLTLDTQNPGDGAAWVVDQRLFVRGLQATLEDGSGEVRTREGASEPFHTVVKYSPDEDVDLVAVHGSSLLLTSTLGRDTKALVAREAATGAERVLAQATGVDAGDVLLHPRTLAAQAVSFSPARTRWTAIDPSIERDLQAIGKLSDGDFSITSRDDRDSKWIVRFVSDHASPRWYVWDRQQQRGLLLFEAQPKLGQAKLAALEPVELKARDGLPLHGYLTLPPGVKPHGLPLVLLVHGGPWARDQWGFNSWAQWLANRGYAVLQLNYRGSTGYGKRFLNAGNKQWGLAMHTDLLDGVQWAVRKGIADEKRVAVVGGSYGGYAALAALTFTPASFACAVDIVGPSNLRTLLASIPPYWKTVKRTFNVRMGNVDDPRDAQLIHDASPLFKADQIVKPLLIGQGKNDPRVNVRESEQIVEAIAKRGGKVTYVLYSDEGHGFRRPENSTDFNARAEGFLAKCLGGRAEPLAGERVPGSTAEVRVVGGP